MQRQTSAAVAAPTAGAGFEGLGTGLAGATVNSAPPDPNGDVGPNAYVQIVNPAVSPSSRKTGSVVYGPVNTKTLWQGFGGVAARRTTTAMQPSSTTASRTAG